MFGAYSRRAGGGGQTLPRVAHLSISRYQRALPKRGEPLEFLVAVHEEGTGIAWQQNVRLDPEDERFLIRAVADLQLWSLDDGLTPDTARTLVEKVGETLVAAFLGDPGRAALSRFEPTAVLLGVDETILDLPWELVLASASELGLGVPFGRIVTARSLPRPRRDELDENPDLNILAVAAPGDDLAATAGELEALHALEKRVDNARVKVKTLEGKRATRAGLAAAVKGRDFDIVHFAGHGEFKAPEPATSELKLADGPLTADDIANLAWAKPPFIVFSSACESSRAGARRRLVSRSGRANGLAAAFLAAGVEAYLGYFWPVLDTAAAAFADTFYTALFANRNIGQAVLDARLEAWPRFREASELTAFSATFFGDAGSAVRRTLDAAAV